MPEASYPYATFLDVLHPPLSLVDVGALVDQPEWRMKDAEKRRAGI